MPIYEFSCNQCGRVFDLMVLGAGQVEMKCPDCGCQEVTKLISATSHTVGLSTLRTGDGGQGGVTTNKCGSNSCTTLDIPGRTA